MRVFRQVLNLNEYDMKFRGTNSNAFLLLLSWIFLLTACEKVSVEDNVNPEANKKNEVREASKSVDDKHSISTFVTRTRGMGVLVDGAEKQYDDFGVRYCPVISDDGDYGWVEQMPGRGYDVIWNDQSILHSSVCLDFLTASNKKAVVIESVNAKNVTNLYLIDMSSGAQSAIASFPSEYIEDVGRFSGDKFGVITSKFDSNGNKQYNVYRIDGTSSVVNQILTESPDLVKFPIQKDKIADELTLDFYEIHDNDRYLFNALELYCEGNDAFAYGNNFRGRQTWDVSYRIRGLWELYSKTHESVFKERLDDVIYGLLHATNQYTGITENDWNPSFLWSSKCYSVGYEPVALLVDDAEILSGLLLICNLGGAEKYRSEIVKLSKKAFDYYEKYYSNGHYYLPKGMPMQFDGIVVPWNYQNAMAEVALGLYIETNEQKYLERCNDLLSAFMSEWTVEDNRIIWHYWPQTYYDGWSDDGRSTHTPSSGVYNDVAYEDASHAGISVRLLARYYETIPNGPINAEILKKIESNMTNFCYKDGFSRFISGYKPSNAPKAWHYWISPYFTYLHNAEFEKYVRQGYLRCFPSWDSQGALFANAKLYYPGSTGNGIKVVRKKVTGTQLMELETFQKPINELYDFFGINN